MDYSHRASNDNCVIIPAISRSARAYQRLKRHGRCNRGCIDQPIIIVLFSFLNNNHHPILHRATPPPRWQRQLDPPRRIQYLVRPRSRLPRLNHTPNPPQTDHSHPIRLDAPSTRNSHRPNPPLPHTKQDQTDIQANPALLRVNVLGALWNS